MSKTVVVAAAVIYNNEPGDLLATLGEGTSTIPAIGITQEDGDALMGKLGQSADVESSFEQNVSAYEAWDGTSMATPHVSGVAALVWSAFPNLTNVQIRNALTGSALDLGDRGRDVYYGFGLVQAKDALLSLGWTPPSPTSTPPTPTPTLRIHPRRLLPRLPRPIHQHQLQPHLPHYHTNINSCAWRNHCPDRYHR